jgi:hypothetical protein
MAPMTRAPATPWTCPECHRQFARTKQSHDCAPAMTIDEYFSTGPVHERPVFDAVMQGLTDAGIRGVHVEPVSVGIFLKNPHKFAELRTMTRWTAISFSLRRRATHRTITRKVVPYGGRYHHVANVADPAGVDDGLVALLVEAYEAALTRRSDTSG